MSTKKSSLKSICTEKFSVLLPVYKKENPVFFDESLKSIFCQTILPSEVVICLDGELTTGLNNIVAKYKKKYPKIVKVVEYPINRGLGMTLRDGLTECSNEVVFRMDSDDISVKDRFEKQLKALKKGRFDVVGSNIVEYDEQMNKVFGLRSVPQHYEEIKKKIKRRNPINHVSVCFRKSKVIEAGNYVDMAGFEDYFLWIRMINRGDRFMNIQEPLVKVRSGSAMVDRRGGKDYVKQITSFENVLKKNKYITRVEYYRNIAIRLPFAFIPRSIRKLAYQYILRKRVKSVGCGACGNDE